MTTPAKLRELLEAATKGPWVANSDQPTPYVRIETDAGGYPNDGWVIASEMLGPDGPANATLIVAAVNALPDLLTTLESLTKERDEARAIASEAQFLCDRLDSLEWNDGGYQDVIRDYFGHVEPSHARLKSLLTTCARQILSEDQK